MSIQAENENGWIISHQKYFERIEVVDTSENNGAETTVVTNFKLNPSLFEITDAFVKTRVKINEPLSSTSEKVKNLCQSLIELGQTLNIFQMDSDKSTNNFKNSCDIDGLNKLLSSSNNSHVKLEKEYEQNEERNVHLMSRTNKEARSVACEFFEKIKDLKLTENNLSGGNLGSNAIMYEILSHTFIFPIDTKFFCRNVDHNLQNQMNGQKFNLILMDPPWWNKYIRRRKRKQSEAGYQLLENFEIGKLPIDELCEENALVVVWCTNSKSHQNQLIEEIFPNWGVEFLTIWHWLKVTKFGVPICPFNVENKKQPFETIIIGRRKNQNVTSNSNCNVKYCVPKVILSVPSSINSHKPPLVDIIFKFFKLELSNNPKCLELFARYLIPKFTSFGNEVIKLQHSSLYVAGS